MSQRRSSRAKPSPASKSRSVAASTTASGVLSEEAVGVGRRISTSKNTASKVGARSRSIAYFDGELKGTEWREAVLATLKYPKHDWPLTEHFLQPVRDWDTDTWNEFLAKYSKPLRSSNAQQDQSAEASGADEVQANGNGKAKAKGKGKRKGKAGADEASVSARKRGKRPASSGKVKRTPRSRVVRATKGKRTSKGKGKGKGKGKPVPKAKPVPTLLGGENPARLAEPDVKLATMCKEAGLDLVTQQRFLMDLFVVLHANRLVPRAGGRNFTMMGARIPKVSVADHGTLLDALFLPGSPAEGQWSDLTRLELQPQIQSPDDVHDAIERARGAVKSAKKGKAAEDFLDNEDSKYAAIRQLALHLLKAKEVADAPPFLRRELPCGEFGFLADTLASSPSTKMLLKLYAEVAWWHGNVSNVYLYVVDDESTYLLFEGGQTLSGLLDRQIDPANTDRLDLGDLLRLLLDVGEALKALHARNVVHGDVTASNVFISMPTPLTDARLKPLPDDDDEDDSAAHAGLGDEAADFEDRPHAKLGPWRMSHEVSSKVWREALEAAADGELQNELRHLPVHSAAPETLSQRVVNKETDVYMFGTLCWQVFARRAPAAPRFRAREQRRSGIELEPDDTRLALPPNVCPQRIMDLILACTCADPNSRPGMNEVCRELVVRLGETTFDHLRTLTKYQYKDYDPDAVFGGDNGVPVAPAPIEADESAVQAEVDVVTVDDDVFDVEARMPQRTRSEAARVDDDADRSTRGRSTATASGADASASAVAVGDDMDESELPVRGRSQAQTASQGGGLPHVVSFDDDSDDDATDGAEANGTDTDEFDPADPFAKAPKPGRSKTVYDGTAEHVTYEAIMQGDEDECVASLFGYDLDRRLMRSLQPGEWVYDDVISVYLGILVEKHNATLRDGAAATGGKKKRHAFTFSSKWYKNITLRGVDDCVNWFNDLHVFQSDLWLIPYAANSHWMLVVVDFEAGIIAHYDSFLRDDPCGVLPLVDEFVTKVWERRAPKASPAPKYGSATQRPELTTTSVLHVPKQSNGYDCGAFIARYGEAVMEGTEFDFEQDDMPDFRRKMAEEIVNYARLHTSS